MKGKAIKTCDRTNWSTPQWLVEYADEYLSCSPIVHDVCAEPHTAKRPQYWTQEDDALSRDWPDGWFCNPPYGREIAKWTAKAAEQVKKCKRGIMLLPANTGSKWFRDLLYSGCVCEVVFITGRIPFDNQSSNPADSVLIVCARSCEFKVCWVDREKIKQLGQRELEVRKCMME